MERIPLAIVGCGGMGHRHLYGLAELHRAGLSQFDLVAACDPVTENADSLASQAEEFFGRRPAVVGSLEALEAHGVAAVDITTTPRYHHTLGVEAVQRGWHAMIEKPIGLTVRAGNRIRQAAAESGRIVSTAENYRRDPINRLAKALLQAGVIGDPRFMIHHTAGGADLMTISVWRHQKDQSGVLLDVGVHFADIMEYFLGEAATVYAQTRLHEPIRRNPAAEGQESVSNPAGVYGRWQKAMPARFQATAEDAAYATVTFKNGAVCQYLEDHAAHGQGLWMRQIHGSKGSMDMPNDRTGRILTLYLGRDQVIDDQRILDLVPDFALDRATATLFGGERLWRYDFPFEQTDRKLIAVEYDDFAGAILGEHPVEVDAAQGTRSVALSYAMLESGVLGRVVTVDEVLAEQVDAYQREIDEGLGLV
ncbi:MAG TPA: Gfo/Idh/MocA family oxidoreductase [Caldilineaceae bacterium]|nr:Gfo/Idh/MocA family oxidoreductase [Caldilineaceae bacterium]